MKYRKPDGETQTRRISIRVSPRLFKELDDKRHAHGSDWQTIGMRLWQEWLRSSADPADNFYTTHRAEHEMLDYVLNEGTQEHASWITGNLKMFIAGIRAMLPQNPEDLEKLLAQLRQAERIRSNSSGKIKTA